MAGKRIGRHVCATLPLEMNAISEDTEEITELLELETSERFCENVCNHVIHVTVS